MMLRKFGTLSILLWCLAAPFLTAQTFSVVYSFQGSPDGANPAVKLIFDNAGNLCGTTSLGGASNAGTIFKITPSGDETFLYSFTGGTDGGNPGSDLIIDSGDNVYGTTLSGGSLGEGTAFELGTDGINGVIHSFGARKDGSSPAAALAWDGSGDIYGTTLLGGSANRGTIFKIDASGHESLIHSFRGSDGADPRGQMIRDSAGNFYGTTYGSRTTWGNVFKLTLPNVVTVLHMFTGKADGGSPHAGLIMNSAGILFGTTVYGGKHRAGTVFKVNPVSGQETVLYSFAGGADGGDPYGGVVMDSAGNLYGTTYYGGAYGYGTIFKVDSAGNESVLYSFTGSNDGLGPMAGLLRDASGALYGTTLYGGAYGAGVVFKLIP